MEGWHFFKINFAFTPYAIGESLDKHLENKGVTNRTTLSQSTYSGLKRDSKTICFSKFEQMLNEVTKIIKYSLLWEILTSIL